VHRKAPPDPLRGTIDLSASEPDLVHRLTESEHRLEALLHGSGGLLFVTGADGTITFVAGAVPTQFGAEPTALLGTDVVAQLRPSDRARARAMLSECATGAAPVAPDDFWIERTDGSWVCLALQLDNHLGDPFLAGIVVTGTDVTDRRNLTQARAVISGANSAIVHATNERDLFDEVCRLVVSDVTYHLAWVGFSDPDRALGIRMVAFADHSAAYFDALEVLAGTDTFRGPLVMALESHELAVIQDISTLPDSMAAWKRLATDFGFRSMIALPLPFTEDDFGVLAIYSEQVNVFNREAVGVLEELASDLAFGIEAIRTRAQRADYRVRFEDSLEAVVRAIATAAELRDPYTAGHQRGVAKLAVAIGDALGLDAHLVVGVGIAGSIHDIGKLAIPAEILSKPGRLSASEFALVKEHARAGYDIVVGIDFPAPVADMILQHHERLDGSGYPTGCRGDEIGIGARILAVADTVEAMHAHRPYRPGLGIDAALEAIDAGRGTLFDRAVVDACTRLFTESGFEFSS